MIDPEDGPGWEQQEETEKRRFFEDAQKALADDDEAYREWLERVDRQNQEIEDERNGPEEVHQ